MGMMWHISPSCLWAQYLHQLKKKEKRINMFEKNAKLPSVRELVDCISSSYMVIAAHGREDRFASDLRLFGGDLKNHHQVENACELCS